MNSNPNKQTEGQLLELIRLYQQSRSNDIATVLIKRYEAIAAMAARKMSRHRSDLYEDLYQVGRMALLRLFVQFDSSIGNPFEVYALKSIIGYMKNYLRDKTWYIQIPRGMREKGLLAQKIVDELTVSLERIPTIRDIAERLRWTIEETANVLNCMENCNYISLDTPITGSYNSMTHGDVIGSEHNEYRLVEDRLDMERAFKHLKIREKQVLLLAINEGKSQRFIAGVLGISQMSVSRLQRKAVDKLRKQLTHESQGEAIRR